MAIKTEALWHYQKSKLKQCFPKLTDKDLDFDESRKAEMIRTISRLLNISPREIKMAMVTL